jgi:inner membrane protein
MNTYGIRLLMPLSERWFYGDVLFIIDIWIWIMLGLGVWMSRRRAGTAGAVRPARISLALSSVYILAMGLSSHAAERMARQQAEAQGLGPVTQVVASPVPLNPFRREIVFATPDTYGFGTLDWLSTRRLTLDPQRVKTHMDDPALSAARGNKSVADFLYWARLPMATVARTPKDVTVTLGDGRYQGVAKVRPFVVTVKLPAANP